MDRDQHNPFYRLIRDRVESYLDTQRFRLDQERLSYGSFASATVTYVRGPLGCPNFHIELHWDGRDWMAWITYWTLPSDTPAGTSAVKNLESSIQPKYAAVATTEQAEGRALELTQRLDELIRGLEREKRRRRSLKRSGEKQ